LSLEAQKEGVVDRPPRSRIFDQSVPIQQSRDGVAHTVGWL